MSPQWRVKSFCLHLFQDKEPRGIIPLENLSIREVEDSKKPVSVPATEPGARGVVIAHPEDLKNKAMPLPSLFDPLFDPVFLI